MSRCPAPGKCWCVLRRPAFATATCTTTTVPIPRACPVVLGHESAGVVESVGRDVRYVKPGDHVITCFSAFCGHCEHCLTGRMEPLRGAGNAAPARRAPRISQSGERARTVCQPGLLRRVHARARTRGRQSTAGHALRTGGADRLRRRLTGVGAVIHTAKVRARRKPLP